MIRFAFATIAAAMLTSGTVAALAEMPVRKASIDGNGQFCLRTRVGDTMMEKRECRSKDDWAKDGIAVIPRRK